MITHKKFSHVPNFTGYMDVVYKIVNSNKPQQKILDIPAGNGLLAEKLSEQGHLVICADINKERDDYVYADMMEPLPFSDKEFDTIICMEGIEHVIEPTRLISELCRVCKSEGTIIITVPNIQNLYSRLQFMCTGTFFQFPPSLPAQNNGEKTDLGHISPLSFTQLRYLFKYYNADISQVSGDKYKKKILIPLLIPFSLAGYFWTKIFKQKDLAGNPVNREYLFSPSLLFSRSLVLAFIKNN